MSLVEIARFNDVYEADLAAAFLESHGIPVAVTERHQTTIDPLMQRALSIRIMGAASNLAAARDLLVRASAGEFASDEGEPVEESLHTRTATVGILLGMLAAGAGLFWGTTRARRLRAVHWVGMGLIGASALLGLYLISRLYLP